MISVRHYLTQGINKVLVLTNTLCYLHDFHKNIATPDRTKAVPQHLKEKEK